ncbi:MAG: glycerophosphodiester phosphodiesterase [Chloroflexota bacterium]|nr:glycerophosphodiester phosphodiesterase [Chloroflexota bacterium]
MTHPLIVAHRSLTPGATENARSAIAMAAQSGADLIELDIRLTIDRQPVVLHDAFLGRSTRGRGWVRLWPSFALTRLPLREAQVGDRVSSLRTILQNFPDDAQPALHLKDRAALSAVLRAVSRYGRPGRTWLWLEHPRDVYTATRRLPELRVTLLRPAGWMPHSRQSYFEEAQWVGAAGVSVPWGVVDAGLVQHAHRHHLLVFSRLERMATLESRLDAGLDGVITSDPQSVRQYLNTREP